AQQLNISRTSLRRILHKDFGLFAYKLQLTQEAHIHFHLPALSIPVAIPDDVLDSSYEENMTQRKTQRSGIHPTRNAISIMHSIDSILVNIFNNMSERQWVTPCHLSLQIFFMSKFETEVKDKFEYFPRVWFRYVDDIFAVFDTKAISLDNFVAKLNNRFPT
ncbi:hypothetical protein NQ318_021112, partial [Aromia moschata]